MNNQHEIILYQMDDTNVCVMPSSRINCTLL